MTPGKIILQVLVFIYLFLQSKSDHACGMVYKLPNRIMLFISLLCWGHTFFTEIYPGSLLYPDFRKILFLFIMQAVAVVLVFVLASANLPLLGRIMQPADAKAFMIIYFSTVFTAGADQAILALLIVLVAGHTVFLAYYGVLKRKPDKGRKPYFPFITAGYLLYGISAYGRMFFF